MSSTPIIDKFGRDYAQLLTRQGEELAQWRAVLKPEVYSALVDWCEMVNGPAEPWTHRGAYKAGGLHSCPITQELFQFVMAYTRKKAFTKVETNRDADIL